MPSVSPPLLTLVFIPLSRLWRGDKELSHWGLFCLLSLFLAHTWRTSPPAPSRGSCWPHGVGITQGADKQNPRPVDPAPGRAYGGLRLCCKGVWKRSGRTPEHRALTALRPPLPVRNHPFPSKTTPLIAHAVRFGPSSTKIFYRPARGGTRGMNGEKGGIGDSRIAIQSLYSWSFRCFWGQGGNPLPTP